MASSLTVTGSSTGEPAGSRTFGPLTITNMLTVGESFSVALLSGDNSFTVPANSVAVVVLPPANNSVVLKLRTNANSGDGGLPIAPGALPTVYPFPAPAPTSLIVNAASSVTGAVTIAFI